MTAQCFTCTKPTEPVSLMSICDHDNVRTALTKHFWFSEDESCKSSLCKTCWSKIEDFHQFYCEVERIHSHLQVQIPNLLDEVKQELSVQVNTTASHSAADTTDKDTIVESGDRPTHKEGDIDTLEHRDALAEETFDEISVKSLDDNESEDEQSCRTDDNDPDFNEDTEEEQVIKQKTRKRRKKTGRRVGRPVQSWQKCIKDEEFIAENINLECDTCAQKYSAFQELQKHSLMQHGKRAYVFCCDRKFSRKPRLIDHIQFHLNPAQFRCDICSKQFQHSEALKGHKDKLHTADEEKTLQCSMCPKTFSRKRFLSIHEKYHRKLGEKNWHCASCNRYFAYESMLRQHHRVAHSKEFKYVCHVCAKGFHILSSYTSHVALHDENSKREKPPEERMQCAQCGSWVFKKGFRRHMLRHSGSQTCEHCGQECKSEMALRYHKAQHRKGDFNCSVCGKAFKRQLTLKEHMASHTGEVLYHCDFCEKTFNSHANRAAHRKKMHPKEWLEDKMRKNPSMQQDNQAL